MSLYYIQKSTLEDIADAIREKTGESGNIKVSEMADKVESIETGGGSSYESATDALDDLGDTNQIYYYSSEFESWICSNSITNILDAYYYDSPDTGMYYSVGGSWNYSTSVDDLSADFFSQGTIYCNYDGITVFMESDILEFLRFYDTDCNILYREDKTGETWNSGYDLEDLSTAYFEEGYYYYVDGSEVTKKDNYDTLVETISHESISSVFYALDESRSYREDPYDVKSLFPNMEEAFGSENTINAMIEYLEEKGYTVTQ